MSLSLDQSLVLNSANVVFKIGPNQYLLTAPSLELDLNNVNPASIQGHIRLEFHGGGTGDISLGTPNDLMVAVEQSLVVTGGAALNLGARVADIKKVFQALPMFNQVVGHIENTRVFITDIVIDLTKAPAQGQTPATFSGEFTLGMRFVSPVTPPPLQLFNVSVTSFGGVVTFKLSGAVSDLGSAFGTW